MKNNPESFLSTGPLELRDEILSESLGIAGDTIVPASPEGRPGMGSHRDILPLEISNNNDEIEEIIPGVDPLTGMPATGGTQNTFNIGIANNSEIEGIENLLDLDGNGVAGAFSDGIMAARLASGLTGEAVTSNAVADDATRRTPEEIQAFYDRVSPFLDVDDNGVVGTFSDIIMIIRDLTGLNGDAVTSGAVAENARRTDPGDIEAYIGSLLDGTVSSENQAPVLEPVGDLEVMPGGRLEVQLQATDPDGDAIIFSLGNSSDLPTGMLEGNGTLVFTPTIDELGTYSFIVIASDGELEATREVTLEVIADTVTTTRISGTIQNTEEEPLADVPIELGDLQTVTAADGSFTIEITGTLPSDDTLRIRGEEITGDLTYPFIAEKLPLLLGRDPLTGVNNVISRPIFLPAIDMDNGVEIDPSVDTMVTTDAIPGAEVFVAAGTLESMNGGLFTEELSITEVPRDLTPASLPENLLPDVLVTIQPAEMVFTTPAPLSMPNEAGYDPGTVMDLWSINPETGEFEQVGTGEVSADGSTINTMDGGIRNSSWHFFTPPPEVPTDTENNPYTPKQGCPTCTGAESGNSEVELHSGAVLETHDLVPYQSLGVSRGLTLSYDSLRADPRPILHFGYANVQADPLRRLVAELAISRGDFEFQVPGFAGGDFGLDGGEHFWSLPGNGGPVDAALQADLRFLSSGRYDYELTTGLLQLNDENLFSGSTSTSSGQLLHVNTINSPFGNGWGLAGWQELVENPDGSVLVIDGDGGELLFEASATGDGYDSPPGDFSTLERLPNGTFQRTMKDQTVYSFNGQNQLARMVDRNGNETEYVYTGGQLSSIVDPVGLETTFTYTNGRVTAIADPGGRETLLEYDAAGNLTGITDPDGTQRTWEYDGNNHMTAEIDKRGNREETTYDFAGRADAAVAKDGSELDFDPVQVQGLYEPDETIDPLGAPVAFQLGAVESSYVDANGNTIAYTLDQAGQIVSAMDEVGALPTVVRNEENLVTSSTDARGNVTSFTYDENGNVLSIEDEITGGGGSVDSSSVSGSIAVPGEVDEFTFEGTAGQRLYYDGLGSDFNIDAQLLSPSGDRIFDINANSDRGLLTLTETGTYRLVLDGGFGDTGDYSFQLLDVADAPTLNLGTIISDSLDPGVETDIYKFRGTAGQRVLVDSIDDGAIFSNGWAIYGPGSQRLNNTTLGIDFEVTLPADGTYALVLNGNVTGGTTNYSFRLVDTSDAPVAVSGLDEVFTGEIAEEQQETFTFTAPAGRQLYFDSLDGDNDPVSVEIVDPTETRLFFGTIDASFDRGPFTLQRSGTYTVTVLGDGSSSVGDYNFRILDLEGDATPLTLGETVTANLSGFETEVYSFTGTPGQQLYFDSLVPQFQNVDLRLIGPDGTSLFTIDSGDDRAPLTLSTPGTYYLTVENDGEDAADTAFRLYDIGDVTALTLDETVTGSLDPGIESDLYRFEGVADEKLFFDSLGNASGSWLLYGPSDEFITSNSLSRDFETTLSRDGTYVLVLDGTTADGTSDYSFQVVTPERTETELTLDETVTGSISEVGEVDEFTFEGVGKQVYFDAQGTDFNVNVELVSPNGNRIFFINSDDDAGPFTLTEAGDYRLIVNGDFGETGDYSFRLLDTAEAPTFSLDTSITNALDPGLETDLYQYTGTAGETLFFNQLASPAGGSWRLYGFTDDSVGGSSFLSSNFEATLPADGTYVLALQGTVSSGTINYSFEVLSPERTSTELTLGETVTGTISEPGEVDEFTFTGVLGQRVYFDSLGIDSNVDAQLFSPSGVSIFNIFSDDDRGPFTLTEAGTYRLVMDGGFGDTGDYSFRLLDVASAPSLTVGTTVTDTLDPGIETDIYQFAGTAGQRLSFEQLLSPSGGSWLLYDPRNQSLSNRGLGSDFEVALSIDGTYLLVLDGSTTGGTINYSFSATDTSDGAVEVSGLGAVQSGEIAEGAEETFTFTAPAGLPLYFDSLDSDNDPISLEIIDPNEQRLYFQDASFDRGTTILSSSGTYTVTVRGDSDTATGDYNFRLLDMSSAATELTLSTTVSASLSGFETDIYSFTGTPGQQLFFDSLVGESQDVDIRLLSPGGSSIFEIGSNGDRGPFVISTPGTYYLIVENDAEAAADYSFQMLDLASATTLTLDTVITGSLDPGIETDLYQFTGTADQKLFFDSLSTSSGSWFLYGPGNEFITSTSSSIRDLSVTLPRDGTYVLVLDGSTVDGTVDYSFQVVTPDRTTTALTLGEAIAGEITELGEVDEFTFTGAAGQRLYFDGLGTDFNIDVQLFSPSGSSIFNSNTSSDVAPFTLTEAGTYRLVVDGDFSDIGDYNFRLLDVGSAATLTLETEITGSLDPGKESDLYSFEGTAEQRLFFDNLGSFNGSWLLYGPGDRLIDSNSGGFEFGVTLPVDGTYILVLDGERADGTIDYNFQVVEPERTTTALGAGTGAGSSGQRQFTYDPVFNQLTSITDELGRQTLFEIDSANGNVLSTTQAIGEVGGDDDIVTQFAYTEEGLLDTVTDPLGRVTDYDYNASGLLTSITFAVGTTDEAIRQFEYDAAGNQTAIIDENGNRTEFAYDDNNRLISITEADPDGNGPLSAPVTVFSYDATGNLLTSTDAVGNVTQNQYDVLDRLTQTIDPLSQVASFSYDSLGNLVSIVDPLGNETINIYDPRNRLIETIDPDGGNTKFGYDLDDNLNSVIDPVDNETTFVYDSRNRLISETDPLGNTIQYEYDGVDNPIAQTDRNGRRTEFEYDQIDRLIGETWVGTEQAIDYSYDKASNLLAVEDEFSALAFTYDNRDRILTVDNTATPGAPNVVLSYSYDGVGNIESVTDTINGVAGGTNAYSYDALNRLTQLTQTGNDVSDKRVDFGYNAIGQFTSIDRYANLAGTQLVTGTDYVYDELNRLTSLTHNNGTADVAFYNFAYDAGSRITQITDIDGVTDYSYDNRHQLIGADHTDTNNPDESYSYDANGNRVSSSIHGEGYETGDGNRLLSDGTFNYDYDNEGNLIRQTEIATGAVRELEWDYRNRLVAVIDKDAAGNETQRVDYTYDVFDRRIAKAVDSNPQDAANAVVTYFVYDNEDVHLDFVDADGTAGSNVPIVDKRYLHGTKVDQVLAQEDADGTVLWHLSDHLGTVRDLVDNSNTVVNHLTYDSFGNVVNETNPAVDTRYLFTGREFDNEIGLSYYQARYYDHRLGRFISQDPLFITPVSPNWVVNLQFLPEETNILQEMSNLYSYVTNNPTNSFDPSGTDDIKINGDRWRRYEQESANPRSSPHQIRGDHYVNTNTGDRYWPESGEFEDKHKNKSKAPGRFQKKFAKKLGKRGLGAIARKFPVTGLAFFLYDWGQGGLAHAANEATWPLSEVWQDDNDGCSF